MDNKKRVSLLAPKILSSSFYYILVSYYIFLSVLCELCGELVPFYE